MSSHSSLFALGLNHQTAPLAIRERVVFHVERLREALTEIKRSLAREAAILSTCNRTELYVAGDEAAAGAPQLSEWLARYHRFEPDGLRPYLYTLPSEQAVRHVFRVASGLDSMVLGEPQILGQMKHAVRTAEAAGSLVVFLVWVYYSAQVFFLGAEFTHIFANRHGSHARTRASLCRAASRPRSASCRPSPSSSSRSSPRRRSGSTTEPARSDRCSRRASGGGPT